MSDKDKLEVQLDSQSKWRVTWYVINRVGPEPRPPGNKVE